MVHVVSCKRLREKGLDTFLGMVGCCMKDNREEHFEFVHCSVSIYDMNEGKIGVCQVWEGGFEQSCESFS